MKGHLEDDLIGEIVQGICYQGRVLIGYNDCQHARGPSHLPAAPSDCEADNTMIPNNLCEGRSS